MGRREPLEEACRVGTGGGFVALRAGMVWGGWWAGEVPTGASQGPHVTATIGEAGCGRGTLLVSYNIFRLFACSPSSNRTPCKRVSKSNFCSESPHLKANESSASCSVACKEAPMLHSIRLLCVRYTFGCAHHKYTSSFRAQLLSTSITMPQVFILGRYVLHVAACEWSDHFHIWCHNRFIRTYTERLGSVNHDWVPTHTTTCFTFSFLNDSY